MNEFTEEIKNELKYMHGIGMTDEELKEKHLNNKILNKEEPKKSDHYQSSDNDSYQEDLRIGNMVYHIAQQGEEGRTGWYKDEGYGWK